MAAKRGGDLLPLHGGDEHNGEPHGPAIEDTEETSDVSASLFKEMSSEEEMEEVVSGTAHSTRMEADILGLNGAANADSEGETSGEDALLFEIGADDSHYGGLSGDQQSAYDSAPNGDVAAVYADYSLGGSIRFQTEDVPFIRAARRDLDGPLDGPLASLRREDDASLDTFGAKLSSIFEDLREKEKSSPLAGICQDYESCGEEGGEDGEEVSLATRNGAGGQGSTQAKRENVEIECMQEIGDVLIVPGEQGTDVKTISELSLGEDPDVSILPHGIGGMASLDAGALVDGGALKVISSSSREARRKRGRASRELGALLLDAKGNGRGRKAAGLQGGISDAFALAVVRGTTEAGATVEGFILESSEGLGSRVEVRVTRSKALGQLASKTESLDGNSLDGIGSQDVTAKRTGKRSAARGGRLGWGNVHDSCADGALVEGSFILPHQVSIEGQTGAGLETGQVGEVGPRERGKRPGSKSGDRVRKARARAKQLRDEGKNVQLVGSSHLTESHTGISTTDTTQNVKGCKMQSQIEEVLVIPPNIECKQQDAICNLDPQETEPVESVKALESSLGGKRRSNRQKAKAAVQPEAKRQKEKVVLNALSKQGVRKALWHDHLGKTKQKQRRRNATSSTNVLPQIPAGNLQTNPEACSLEELEEPLKTSEETLNEKVDGNTHGGGSFEVLKQVPAKGCKTAKGNTCSKRAIQTRGNKSLHVSGEPLVLEGYSSGCLGEEQVQAAMKPAELMLEDEVSARAAGSSGESLVTAQKNGFTRLERDGDKGCLDTSKESKVEASVCEQGEGLSNSSGKFEEKILSSTMLRSNNDTDCASEFAGEAAIICRTENGVKELMSNNTLPEKMETCSSSPGLLVKVIDASKMAETDGADSVSLEKVGVHALITCGAGASTERTVKDDKCFTNLNEKANKRSNVCGDDGDDAGSATAHDNTTKESRNEQQITELSFSEATPSTKVEGMLEMDPTGVAEKISIVNVTGVGRGRLARSQKGCAPKKKTVDMRKGSGVARKGTGRGKKGVANKKVYCVAAGSTAVREDASRKKTSTASRRGKRRLSSETVVDMVETSKEITTAEGVEPSKNTVMVDVKEPVSCSNEDAEIPKKKGKLVQKGRNPTKGAEAGVAKKKRKTGKQQEPPSNGDASTVALIVTANCEGPADVVPSGSKGKLKASQRGKVGLKKSEKATTGKKVARSTPGAGKSKRAKKPPCLTVKSKGATIKVLSSIKDQASEQGLPCIKDQPVGPKVAKCSSKLPEELGSHGAICHGEAGDVGKGEVAVGSASLNQETIGDGSMDCTKIYATTELQDIEAVRDLESGAVGEDVSSGVTEGGDNKGSEKGIDSAGAEMEAARRSWVLCDDCNKWRCIPVELADQIESTNARWSCRENPDKEFQKCSVPQEKSNAEINAELQISEASVCEEGDDKDAVDSKSMNLGAANADNKPAVWKRVRRNIFQHRRRKVLEIDEMMVCQCTPPKEGDIGCGDNCLNRMLSIECVAEQCPCGEACSNQQFQNRTYAPIEMYRCGRKGFGLRVVENVSKGTFIIEYVGEVLDVGAFEARQQEYARKGQKHFYFMTLNTNEVIDACSKGNFGRFINHSCEPNCRTEKWMVNGEVCIGLFAVRDIAKDEEVTFDYNYVRVCGAAAKKCECGSAQCRGFIGGDPLTPKAVVESDSEDEEDLEPIMLEGEDEDLYANENKVAPCKKPRAETEFQDTSTMRTTGIKRKLTLVKEKAPSIVKRFKTSSSARRSSFVNNKGLTLDVGGGRHEGTRTIYFSDVQEKLDDMLDRNGGLRRKRDAAKQYLKLLVLTSASGDNRKDATACSVRDLSLLLEALLKTTSRTVLSDIMNKNGLRMLHNLIKQLRRQWDKTPILRKLIKVLELLASERVLTIDLINSSPPCSGMESFSESLFELTRHKDAEVVQMVRRFRNKWMPPRSQLYDQHYRGFEKSFSVQSMQSLSPVVMQQSDQLNASGHKFQSPQHLKQASSTPPLTGSEVSRPGSSEPQPHGGSLSANQPHNGQACLEEGVVSKDDIKSSMNPSVVSDECNSGKPEEVKKRPRKRPSRWDAPAKVEKSSKHSSDPSVSTNQSDAQVMDSCVTKEQACTFPASHVPQGSMQFQLEDPRHFVGKSRSFPPKFPNSKRVPSFHHDLPLSSSEPQQGVQEYSGQQSASQASTTSLQGLRQGVGPPGPQSTWPSSTSTGLQEPARLPNGGISGQLQLHPGSSAVVAPRGTGPGLPHLHTQHLQGMVPTAQFPGASAMQMQMGPPLMSSGPPQPHAGLQQMSVPNAIQIGGPPLPGRGFPQCPPMQMGGGVSPAQGMHGGTPQITMGTVPIPLSYTGGPRPPSMLPNAPYVQWQLQTGAPHFAVQPSFPTDLSHKHSIPAIWPLKRVDDGPQRVPTLQENLSVKRSKVANMPADVEPEPPVPGLSPPLPPAPPPSGRTPVSVNYPGSDAHGYSQIHHISEREFCQEWEIPLHYVQMRDREFGHDYYGPRDADTRDSGEYWETPEAEGFRDDVFALVVRRVQKHHKLRTRGLDTFCSKMADVIVRKEVAKYMEQRSQGIEKIIHKTKLVEKVDSYVDNQVGVYLTKIDKSHRS